MNVLAEYVTPHSPLLTSWGWKRREIGGGLLLRARGSQLVILLHCESLLKDVREEISATHTHTHIEQVECIFEKGPSRDPIRHIRVEHLPVFNNPQLIAQ